jgi:hypothetical protein
MQKISPTYVRAGIVLLTVLFLVCCVWAAYAGFFLVAGARRVVNAGHTLQDVFANEQGIDALQKSKSAISDLGTGLADLERGMKVLSVARHTPFLGRRYEAFSATLQAAVHIQKALEKTIVVALDVAEVADNAAQISRALGDSTTPYAELSAQERSLVARSFAGSADELQAIAVELELADGNLERASRYISSGVAAGWLRILDERIKQAKEAVAVLLPLSRIAPEALGLAAEKQFLVLFLNETELRGGGGFIGAFGFASVKDGSINNFTVVDSYSIDEAARRADPSYHVTPPVPISTILGVKSWYARDSAWSPSFPTSAQTAVTLVRQEMAVAKQSVPDLAGVIGITPSCVERILRTFGAITIEGTRYDAANITDLLEYHVEIGYQDAGLDLAHRKDILQKLTDALMQRLLSLPPREWPRLFTLLNESFAHKELAFMLRDPSSQSVLVQFGMSGELSAATQESDVLMLVDANLGALKTDPAVARHVAYQLVPTQNGFRAKVDVTYKNKATFTWKTTRYQSYTRLYVPAGSVLVEIDNGSGAVVEEDAGRTSFGTYITIEPGHEKTLTFVYDLPPGVVNAVRAGSYQLLVDKQMGAGDNALTLNLDFGTNVVSAEPAEEQKNWGNTLYSWEGLLDTNRTFYVDL